MPYKLDTDTHVYFYENEFYCLSNFSAFRLRWEGVDFDTSEHAYHWEQYRPLHWDTALRDERHTIQQLIVHARSAHEAFKTSQQYRHFQRSDWPAVKVDVMRSILRTKAQQHEYVQRKLLETGTRALIEDSWRDSFWGWGPEKHGVNMLGKLWMELRAELQAQAQTADARSTPGASSPVSSS